MYSEGLLHRARDESQEGSLLDLKLAIRGGVTLDRVLAGAAADFKNALLMPEINPQNLQNRVAISFAGRGKRALEKGVVGWCHG